MMRGKGCGASSPRRGDLEAAVAVAAAVLLVAEGRLAHAIVAATPWA